MLRLLDGVAATVHFLGGRKFVAQRYPLFANRTTVGTAKDSAEEWLDVARPAT